MFHQYYLIYSALKFEDKETGETKFIVKGNQVKFDGSLSSFQKYFYYTEDEFDKVFGKKCDYDLYNLGLEGAYLDIQMVPEPVGCLDKVPQKKSK